MKNIEKIFVSIFIIILFVFMIFTLSNNEKISYIEKRELKQFPSIKKIFKSNFFDELTEAYNDQLFLRNHLITGYYLFQFQRYLGDVVIGEDDEMFSAIQEEDISEYESNLKDVSEEIDSISKEIIENDTKFIFLSIPRKDAVMEEKLPKTYTSSKNLYVRGLDIIKNNTNDSIVYIDALELFNNSENNCYFKTDHHININGANIILSEIINTIKNDYKIKEYNFEDYFKAHSTYINGSFNKQIGQSKTLVKEDLFVTLKDKLKYTRFENGKKSDLSIWGSGNSYESAYMSGDRAETVVETNRKELPNIMYVGSSFTNILEALSIPLFNRVVSIDYRHNDTNKSILDYVKKYDIDYVIFIPSQSDNALSYNQIRLHLGLND